MRQNKKIRLIQLATGFLLLLTLGVHIMTVVGRLDPNLLWYGTIKNNEALRLAGLFSTILYLSFLYALYTLMFKWQSKTALTFSKIIFALGIVYFVLSAIGSFLADTIFHKLGLTSFYLVLAFLFYLLWVTTKSLDKKKTPGTRKRKKR